MITKSEAKKFFKRFSKDAGKTYRTFSKDLSKRISKIQDRIPNR
ncbi:hypothetical protein [Peredibacter starrii]|uniref:Uncharacterized protein n=1 Tax=Peredibacter starrii TaxID=28202 RepID=A0AAX4HUX8_9BACT|nr:hypothetical protein [Peredibacter starrii]WPU66980.1 hypothetical protein SOO65_09475 [Peredibacter starrii]